MTVDDRDGEDEGEDLEATQLDDRVASAKLAGRDLQRAQAQLARSVAASMSQIDWSALTSQIDWSTLMPMIDLAAHAQQIARSVAMPKVVMPKIDLSWLVPSIDPAAWDRLREQLKDLRLDEPPNWPPGVDMEVVAEVIRDDGLPLVWVPRRAIVERVLAASDRVGRVGVLLAAIPHLVQDCRAVLDQVEHEALAAQVVLARSAVDALAGGHHHAAQALAVLVTDTAVDRAIKRGRAEVKERKKVPFDPAEGPRIERRLMAALAPIHRFYTQWFPGRGTPAPEAVSRHVSVHQADPSHYTRDNAVIATLLVCSVLRALQEVEDFAELSDPAGPG